MAAVAVLLAVTVTGLRARGTFGVDRTAAGASGPVLAIALSAAEGLAVIAFVIVLVSARPQRQPKPGDDEEPWRPHLPWWAKTAGVLLAVAALVTPFVVLFTRKPRSLVTRPGAGVPRAGPGTLATPASSPVWPLITGMVIAILVVVVLAVLSRRRRRAGNPPGGRPRRLAALLGSLAAGSDALAAGGEPRAAIIACYAAMERGFAAAGSAPALADTPAEVLARATGAGLVRPEPAETLAGLFRRARYSSYPMTGADSRLAADALTEMRADLTSAASEP